MVFYNPSRQTPVVSLATVISLAQRATGVDSSRVENSLRTLHARLTGEILGSEEPARLLVICLMAGGHVLIEGPPGVGKTSLAQALATAFGGDFRRVQFTPDLLPSDLLGYNLYDQSTGTFRFQPGPVFSHLLLADEINRTSPRIQSALLECMNDGQVSVDGTTYPLEKPFMVVATRNDAYATGTFPLPEPQLDRFLVSIPIALPDAKTQIDVLGLHLDKQTRQAPATATLLSRQQVLAMQAAVAAHPVSPPVRAYVVRLCEAARQIAGHDHALSVRASLALVRAGQAASVFAGRPTVHPDDIKSVLSAVFRHRLAPFTDENNPGKWLSSIVESVDVP